MVFFAICKLIYSADFYCGFGYLFPNPEKSILLKRIFKEN